MCEKFLKKWTLPLLTGADCISKNIKKFSMLNIVPDLEFTQRNR